VSKVTIDLADIQERLEHEFGDYGGEFFKVHIVDDTLQISASGTPYEDLGAIGEEELLDAITQGLLSSLWRTHCQFLSTIFGEERTGCHDPTAR
jgi:hypothetical protein